MCIPIAFQIFTYMQRTWCGQCMLSSIIGNTHINIIYCGKCIRSFCKSFFLLTTAKHFSRRERVGITLEITYFYPIASALNKYFLLYIRPGCMIAMQMFKQYILLALAQLP